MALPLGAGGCGDERPRAYEVRRPWLEAPDLRLESVEIDGVTRPALRLLADQPLVRVPLGAVERGLLELWVADPGAGGGSIQLGLAAAEGSTQCHREASNAEPGWSSCRLSIGAPAGDATLEIRLQGSSGKPWFVSSPLLIADRLPPRPPVFVIVLDTVRADRLVTFNRAIPLGDALDQLAQDGIAFERMRSSSSWTRTAVATLLTGLSADSHGVLGRLDVLEPRLLTLPEILQRQGYVTLAWSTNVNVLPLWGFDQGFDAFTDVGSEQWAGKKPDAREVFELVRRALESPTQAPGFHYVHLIDPHLPYLPEAGELERVRRDPRLADTMPGTSSQEGGERIVAEYPRHLAEILHVDQELGAFLEFLKERGLYRSSLILVAGDHGEEFLDHGFAYHGATLYEEVLRVPAVLKLPGDERAGTRVEGNAGLADLFPTMLSALDVSPPGLLEGRPLLGGDVPEDAVPGRPHFATLQNDGHDLHSVVDGRWKLIVDHDGDDRLFDLSEDPGEKHDLLADQSERAEAMRGLLEARIARRERGWHVRACGGDGAWDLSFVLSSPASALRAVDLEEDDALEPLEAGNGQQTRATLRLSPRTVQREYLGKLIDDTVTDADEIVLTPSIAGDAVELRALPGEELAFTLGAAPERRRAPRVRLDDALRAIASVRPGRPIGCSIGVKVAHAPHLRIWHVDAPAAIPAAEVDPAVLERLRALGYH